MTVENLAERRSRLDELGAKVAAQGSLLSETHTFNEGVLLALEALRDQNKALTDQVISLMEKP